jgi:hypothetical protein
MIACSSTTNSIEARFVVKICAQCTQGPPAFIVECTQCCDADTTGSDGSIVHYILCSSQFSVYMYVICNKEQLQIDAYLAHVPLFQVPSYILTAVLEPLTSGHAKTPPLLLTGACVVGACVGVAAGAFLPDCLLF